MPYVLGGGIWYIDGVLTLCYTFDQCAHFISSLLLNVFIFLTCDVGIWYIDGVNVKTWFFIGIWVGVKKGFLIPSLNFSSL